MSDYGIAQICETGHVITSKANDLSINEPYCSTCGASVINTCAKCKNVIKGSYREVSQIDPPYWYPNRAYCKPLYCPECGEAYPWTKSSKEAVFELINTAEDLTETEKSDFQSTVDDLLTQSPKTVVAQSKFKKYLIKAGSQVASGLKEILIDLVSETVKKSIWSS